MQVHGVTEPSPITPAAALRHAPCPVCRTAGGDVLMELDFLTGAPAGMRLVRCQECGTDRIDPHLPATGLADLYDRSYYEEGYLPFANRRRADFGLRLDEMERFPPVRRTRDQGRPPRCLDVGAGVGLFALEARQRGYDATGVEPSAAARVLARERFDVALADTWPREEQTFDVVTLWDVLGHVEEPEAMLQQARRQLHAEGGLVVKIPNFRSAWHRTRTAMSRRRRANLLHAPTLIWRFHHDGIIRLLERSGFQVHWQRTVREPDLLPLTPRWRAIRMATDVIDGLRSNHQEMVLHARAV